MYQPSVAVVILNYNGRKHLATCNELTDDGLRINELRINELRIADLRIGEVDDTCGVGPGIKKIR